MKKNIRNREQMSIIVNKAKCRKCGEIIESKYRHDFVTCKCGTIAIDGGKDYLKRSAKDFNDIIELSKCKKKRKIRRRR